MAETYWDDETTIVDTTNYFPQIHAVHHRSNGSQWQSDRDSNWRSPSSTEHDSSQNFSSFNSRGGRGGFRPKKFERDRPSENGIEIKIDSSFVGRVIGRGGCKIQELQDESGAYIKVLQADDSDSNLTSVRISGSQESCDKAKELIEELTSDVGRAPFQRDFQPRDSRSSFQNNGTQSNDGDSFDFIDWGALGKQCEEARRKKLESLPPLVKNFYYEVPDVADMSPREVQAIRDANNSTSVSKLNSDDGTPIPNPILKFEHAFHKFPELLGELRKQGFTTPSPIQCQAWPIVLKGHDLIGIAQTGTGKTIAFLFPAMIHIVGQITPREQRIGPSCLILAPTRELAQQIEQEAKKYKYRGISCCCVYGGGSRRNQINVVAKGVDIVIATPGRLNDLVMNQVIDVTGVTYLVLDEADRMLDLGFEPQIRKILIDVRPDRQTIMTSATWTNEVQSLASRYMTNPIKVNVGALDLAAVHSVTQEIIFADDDDRRAILMDFLEHMAPDDKVIVFVDRKCIADDVASDLVLQGIQCQSIHGDREQCDREQALDDLKTGYVKILIATDVASRGLDIKDITHIFNMYFPRNIEEYVHRVGRTGRAGRTGTSISLFTRQDWMHAEGLIKILEEANQEVPEELCEMANRYRAWKRKKDAEDASVGGRRRRGGGGGGGRRF